MLSNQDQGSGPREGSDLERLRAWLENPQRLLRLVTSTAAAYAGPLYRESVEARLREEDVVTLVRLLAHVALSSRQLRDETQAAELVAFFRQRLQGLPADLVLEMERILSPLPTPAPGEPPMPVQLAETLALRNALETYRRGNLSASDAHALLGRLSAELGTLRRTLGVPAADDYGDQLEAEFWAALPEPEPRRVLLSAEAWCVPPRALRRYVEELREQFETARAVLEHYADCVHQPAEAARARAALGMSELADLYAYFGGPLLESAIGHAGRQLAHEFKPDMQALLGNALARLSQHAASRRDYRALRQALELLDTLERAQPPRGQELRTRISVESRLRDFVHEAVAAPALPRELVELLRQAPQAAAELLCEQFESRSQRSERERLVEMAAGLGPVGVGCLREKLRSEPPAHAVPTVGLLSRLDPAALAELLPARLGRWSRPYHDAVVRLLAAGGAPERGRLLVRLLEYLDPLVVPGALDEIGLTGDAEAAPRLMRLAGGTLPQSSEPYLRVKALEALGRLREPAAAPLLRRLVEAKSVWRWSEPREIRIAAAQALLKIDPEWAEKCCQRSGLSAAELAVAPLDPEPATPWVRQRRYPRIPLPQQLPTLASTLRGQWELGTQVLSLGGGLAESQVSLPAGTEVEVEFQFGLRSVRATAVVRDPRPPLLGFEILRIDLDERSKLRRLLTPYWQQRGRPTPPPA